MLATMRPMPQRDAAASYPLTLGEEPAFCPACGQGLVERVLEEDHRPRLVCPDGHVTWRNPRLVVGTLPIRDGRVHLARRSIEPGAGRWTYPGGFLEMGEAAQEGARRETEEETQLRVEVGRLIGAYSRPYAGVVTLIYEATIVGGEVAAGGRDERGPRLRAGRDPVGRACLLDGRERAARLGGVAAGARAALRAGAVRDRRPERGLAAPTRSGGRRPPRSGRRSRTR